MTQNQQQPLADVIDVFSANCPLCEDAVRTVKDTVQSCGCTVRERPWEEGPQKVQTSEGGAYPVPSISVGGRVIFEGIPDPEDVQCLRQSMRITDAAGRGRQIEFTVTGSRVKRMKEKPSLLLYWLCISARYATPFGVMNRAVCFVEWASASIA